MTKNQALEVARNTVAGHPGYSKSPDLRIYLAKNGQYMTDRLGSPFLTGRPVWTCEQFVKEMGAFA